MKYLNVKLAFCGMFMNTTLRAGVHLGKDYDTHLHYAKNHVWDSLGQLFGETKRLICEQSEILGPETPEIVGRGERFRRTQITNISCACDCGRRPVSVGAFFFLLSSSSHPESCFEIQNFWRKNDVSGKARGEEGGNEKMKQKKEFFSPLSLLSAFAGLRYENN